MKYFLASMLFAAADQLSKEAIKRRLPKGEKKRIWGRLFLWHRKNRGLAYNKLDGERKKVMAASVTAVSAAAAYLLFLVKNGARPLEKLGPALILGGGLGNLIDRIRDKEVTDFIYIETDKAPIFNLADVTAVLGAVITAVSAIIS